MLIVQVANLATSGNSVRILWAIRLDIDNSAVHVVHRTGSVVGLAVRCFVSAVLCI